MPQSPAEFHDKTVCLLFYSETVGAHTSSQGESSEEDGGEAHSSQPTNDQAVKRATYRDEQRRQSATG